MKNLWKMVGMVVLLFGLVMTGCGQKQENEITFVLDWTPNTNHTGVYVALEKGYFDEQGLDVTIIQPSEGTADQAVAMGSAQFGVSYQENVTFARGAEMPLVSVAAVIQHNTSGFGSLAEKNIQNPKDFEGKTYGGWGGEIEQAMIRYLMEEVGADFSKVKILTTGDIDFFTASSTGQIDFAWMYEGWTLVEAQIRDIEMNYFPLIEISEVFDYYTPVIITNENMIENQSEIVDKMMSAIAKGYRFTIENPTESADILLKHAPELDADLVHQSQIFLTQQYQATAPYWGYQDEKVWKRYTEWLYTEGFIDEMIDVSKAFSNAFVEGQ